MPHNVLRLITRLNIGGPARQALLLTHALADRYPTVLAAGEPSAHEGELSDPRVPVVSVPLVREVDPVRDLAAFRAVRRLIARTRPALIHTHMAKAGAIARMANRTMADRARTVHTFHGHVLDGYFGARTQAAMVRAERALAARTDVLVAVSDEVRDDLLARGIGRPGQFRVIPLGFDLGAHLAVSTPSGHLRRRFNVSPGTPLIAVVGRLAPIKCHDLLVTALVDVPDAHLVVFGDGEQRQAVEALTRRLGIAQRVHWAGWVHDIPTALSDVDLVALSSRNEGTPVSLIEAQACGLPVVSTNVGGVRSVVRDGETGLLVPSGDASTLAAALRRLVGDPDLRQRMGAAGRAQVRDRFSHERLIRDIQCLYDELVQAS